MIRVKLTYINNNSRSRGFAVRLEKNEFLFAGMDFQACFIGKKNEKLPIHIIDKGYYVNEEWFHLLYPRREGITASEPFTVIGPGVYKIKLCMK